MKLSAQAEGFILHWGEMGTRWGVNRTVAQIQALLYLSPQPMHAEEIAETLNVARSNVSTSLRELQNWGLAKIVHVLGDRRDHFETQKDVWLMFQVILRERKRREVDPTLNVLKEALAEKSTVEADAETRLRLKALLDFFETFSACYDQLGELSPATLRQLAGLVRKLGG
jgi:DNA-binding transcriptional regulator GbsR (MarR family)